MFSSNGGMWQNVKSHASYWIGQPYTEIKDKTDPAFLMRLSNIRRGVSNFVKIMTGKDIPVRFSSGEQSYTDGESVVISATTKDEHFDSMVGLALHESSHIMFSFDLFAVAKMLFPYEDAVYDANGNIDDSKMMDKWSKAANKVLPADVIAAGIKAGRPDAAAVSKDVKFLLNILEDRHIDSWMYANCGGYRPYYESMYARYFYSDMVNQAMNDPIGRVPTFKNYEMHILNMFTEDADPDALPHLREIWSIIDLPNIMRYHDDKRWPLALREIAQGTSGAALSADGWPLILANSFDILRIVYANAVEVSPEDNSQQANDSNEGDSEGEEDSDLENLDHGDGSGGKGKPIDFNDPKNKKLLEKLLKRQGKFAQGKTFKEKTTEEQDKNLQSLENSEASLRSVGAIGKNAKCDVIVYKRIGVASIKDANCPFTTGTEYADSREAVRDGMRIGTVLAHRLRVMNDESTLTYSRQNHGHIDKRLIAGLGGGDANVFAVTHVVKLLPVMVDMSIDASGSMGGLRFRKAMTVAVALAYAASKTRNMRVRINLRSSPSNDAAVGIVYDSKVDTFSKIRQLFPYLAPRGGTPEGLCFEAIRKELLEEVKQTRRFFVNLSDGEPAHSYYDKSGTHVYYEGEEAARHTRQQMEELRKTGIKVLSYFITDSDADVRSMSNNNKTLFHQMYGKDAKYINVGSVTDIVRTLNRLFLSE